MSLINNLIAFLDVSRLGGYFGRNEIVDVTPFSGERPHRIIMCTCNLPNHLLYTRTPTLMLMVLYMLMLQKRGSEPCFVGRRVTPEYMGSLNRIKSSHNSCLTRALIERRNPWTRLRESLLHDLIDLAPSLRPLSVQLDVFWWNFRNTPRW